MEVLYLGNIAPLSGVSHRIGGDPLNIDLAGFWIYFDITRNGVAKRIGERQPVLRQHVHRWAKRVAAIIGSGDIDLADGEIVITDIDLVLVSRNFAREDGDPGPVNQGWIDSRDAVDG